MIKQLTNLGIICLIASALLGMTITDGGDCARILAKFELANGTIIKGYTHSSRLDFENAEKDFKGFLHNSYRNVKIFDSILVYERLDTLQAISIKNYRKHCDFFYLACPIEQRKKISFDDWVGGKMLNKSPCEACNQKEYPYAAGGYSPSVITELNSYEIDRLKAEKSLKNCLINPDELTSIYLVSLNNAHSKDQMATFYNDLSKNLNYNEVKAELRNLDIAIFSIISMP